MDVVRVSMLHAQWLVLLEVLAQVAETLRFCELICQINRNEGTECIRHSIRVSIGQYWTG